MAGIPYRPLDTSRTEIRVLDLLPGRYKSPIKCRLRTVSIADEENLPYYAALSYTWGSAENRRSVIVSVDDVEYSVSITRNLFIAMRGLRPRWRKETLWIDALGINQSDDEERASQVSFMGEVYKSATKTYVWLGCSIEPDSPVHKMHSLHRKLLRLSQAVPHAITDTYVVLKRWISEGSDIKECLGSLLLVLTAGFHTLDQALGHTTPSWQDRVWVLQERLGKSPRVKELESMLFLTYPGQNIQRFRHFLRTFAHIVNPDEEHSARGILGISSLAADSQASDPRDKIFALLGFIEQGSARHIQVDYTAPFWVACVRATYASAKNSRRTFGETTYRCQLKVLELTTCQPDRPPSFPSWVADFSRVNEESFSNSMEIQWPGSRDHFDADLSTDLRCLTTLGVRFGKVVTVLRLYKPAENPESARKSENLTPSDQVALFANLLASALRAHEASETCPHPYPDGVSLSAGLAELKLYLDQSVRDPSLEKIERVLRSCFLCWKSQPVLHQPADDCCCYKSWRPDEYNESLFISLLNASSIQLFASDDGYVGFAPSDIEMGDTIVFLRGAPWPTLLWQSEGRWASRSLVYLCGVMHGELQGAEDEPSWGTEPFVLH
ncbi:hypothetical protein LTR27_008672 [Elasticomyces elasticus]|nr:hypothetical protein LTR27_008672 [Elasticomyces elasticus]